YATNAVKSAVVGAGHASKEQVAMMVQRLLPGFQAETGDATDALAVAICHAHHSQTQRVWSAHARPSPSPPRGEGRGEGATPSLPRGEGRGEGALVRVQPRIVSRAPAPPHPDPLPGGEREKGLVGRKRPRKPTDEETGFARRLRTDSTDVENLLWRKLRNRAF